MKVKLIDFIFFTFRISIIIVMEKKSNLGLKNIFLNKGYESLVLVDGHKRRKLETVNSLIVKSVNYFSVNRGGNRGLYLYYGLFASLDSRNIVESVLTGIKQHYKSEKIKLMKPYMISSEEYMINNKIISITLSSYIKNCKTRGGNVAFYSIL